MTANNITRHSLVTYNGKIYMLENCNRKKPLLISLTPEENGLFKAVGKEIKVDTQLEVFRFPAQLAVEYLQQEAKKEICIAKH